MSETQKLLKQEQTEPTPIKIKQNITSILQEPIEKLGHNMSEENIMKFIEDEHKKSKQSKHDPNSPMKHSFSKVKIFSHLIQQLVPECNLIGNGYVAKHNMDHQTEQEQYKSIYFSKDGKKFVAAVRSGIIIINDIDPNTDRIIEESSFSYNTLDESGQIKGQPFQEDIPNLNCCAITNTMLNKQSKQQQRFIIAGYLTGQLLIFQLPEESTKLTEVFSKQMKYTLKNKVEFSDYIQYIEISPDQTKFVIALKSNKAIEYNLTKFQITRTLSGHTQPILQVRYSPSGHEIITAGSDSKFIVYNSSGRILQEIVSHEGVCSAIAFSPILNDERILSVGHDCFLKVWKRKAKTYKQKQMEEELDTEKIENQTIEETRKYDILRQYKLIGTIDDHNDQINSVDFSPNAKYFASGSSDLTIKVYQSQTYSLLYTFLGNKGFITSVRFSPHGHVLYSSSFKIRYWKHYKPITLDVDLGDHDTIQHINTSQDGTRLVTCNSDMCLRVYDIKTWQMIGKPLVGHQTDVLRAAVSPDQKHIVSGDTLGHLIIWDYNTHKLLLTLEKAHTESIISIEFGKSSQYVMTASQDTSLKRWDIYKLLSGKDEKYEQIFVHGQKIGQATFSSCKNYMISGSFDRKIRVFRRRKMEEILFDNLLTHENTISHQFVVDKVIDAQEKIYTLQFKPVLKDSEGEIKPPTQFISGGFGNMIKIWNVQNYQCEAIIKDAHDDDILILLYAKNGKTFYSGSKDRKIKIWDAISLNCKNVLEKHTSYVYSLCLANDDQYLLSGGKDIKLIVWNQHQILMNDSYMLFKNINLISKNAIKNLTMSESLNFYQKYLTLSFFGMNILDILCITKDYLKLEIIVDGFIKHDIYKHAKKDIFQRSLFAKSEYNLNCIQQIVRYYALITLPENKCYCCSHSFDDFLIEGLQMKAPKTELLLKNMLRPCRMQKFNFYSLDKDLCIFSPTPYLTQEMLNENLIREGYLNQNDLDSDCLSSIASDTDPDDEQPDLNIDEENQQLIQHNDNEDQMESQNYEFLLSYIDMIDVYNDRFIDTLADQKPNQLIFGSQTLEFIIQHKWQYYVRILFVSKFFSFLIFTMLYSFNAVYIYPLKLTSQFKDYQYESQMINMILLCFNAAFLLKETLMIIKHKPELTNFLNLVFIFSIAYLCKTDMDQNMKVPQDLRQSAYRNQMALQQFVNVSYLTVYLRGHPEMSFMIQLITQSLDRIKYFLLIVFMIVTGFSSSIFISQGYDDKGIHMTFFQTFSYYFQVLLGNLTDFVLAEGEYVPNKVILFSSFVVSTVLLLIVLLNLLIAIVCDVYSNVISVQFQQQNWTKIQLIHEEDKFLSIFTPLLSYFRTKMGYREDAYFIIIEVIDSDSVVQMMSERDVIRDVQERLTKVQSRQNEYYENIQEKIDKRVPEELANDIALIVEKYDLDGSKKNQSILNFFGVDNLIKKPFGGSSKKKNRT